MALEAIKYNNEKLEVLDQTLLPVRGAPAIAMVGCLSLAVELKNDNYSEKSSVRREVEGKMNYLISARPTAVNIKIAAEQLIKLANKLYRDDSINVENMVSEILRSIDNMFKKDIDDNRAIGDFGADEILKNIIDNNLVRVLTHCNTGSLATTGYGTALGVVRSLHSRRKLEQVYCTETRPYNQGARLTAYELVHENIPGTLICDDMVAALMKSRKINAVVVGADRVAANGDTANKIGTYQIAILAKYHEVPFYVAAPRTSIDFDIIAGDKIPIEERPEREMTHLNDQRIAAKGIQCWNPAFDVTPAHLITGIITEVGVINPKDLKQLVSIDRQ
ncbi:hypothetical protein G9C98_002167 [Cotesia typhae]|uniref:Methylthioribose-1-phosphate isomerase n=1 Tax=Cotesia typhae TaxID=2053667 RepID=A0A8J5VCT1_9HYME|nr:hypothetical protein G9C98_002167 [Cotesia typhae]